jgi:hypothetical protein
VPTQIPITASRGGLDDDAVAKPRSHKIRNRAAGPLGLIVQGSPSGGLDPDHD